MSVYDDIHFCSIYIDREEEREAIVLHSFFDFNIGQHFLLYPLL